MRYAKMEGKRMTMVLQPDHKNPNAVRPVEPTGPNGRTGSGLNIPPRPAAASPAAATAAPAPYARPRATPRRCPRR